MRELGKLSARAAQQVRYGPPAGGGSATVGARAAPYPARPGEGLSRGRAVASRRERVGAGGRGKFLADLEVWRPDEQSAPRASTREVYAGMFLCELAELELDDDEEQCALWTLFEAVKDDPGWPYRDRRERAPAEIKRWMAELDGT
jgi:hypothetical protein